MTQPPPSNVRRRVRIPNRKASTRPPRHYPPAQQKLSLPSPDGPQTHWETCTQFIASTLTQQGIPTSVYNHLALNEPGPWYVKEDLSVEAEWAGSSPYWPSGEAGDPYTYLGFEIVTPILSSDEIMDFQTVQAVADIQNSQFRSFCNETTGLHVHVGIAGQGFPTETLRKLIAFLYTFEPSITTLHPEHRKGTAEEDGKLENPWCAPLHDTIHPSLLPLPKPQILNSILSAPTLQELGEIALEIMVNKRCVSRKSTAYNVQQLERESGRKTVEFRQHARTLDGERAVLLIRFCVACLEFAGRVGWRSLKVYLERTIEGEEKTRENKHIADMCHAMKFEEGMRAWKDWVAKEE